MYNDIIGTFHSFFILSFTDCQSLTTDNECTGTGICIWNSAGAACIGEGVITFAY